MVHAIIVLPGTTGTDLLMAQDTNPVPPPKPPVKPEPPLPVPPNPASSVVWSTGAFQYAEAGSVSSGATALEQPLYASIPAGYASDAGGYDKGKATGYISLIESIANYATAKSKQDYAPMYTSWPTNAPPLAPQSAQTWGLTFPLTANAVIGWGYDWRQDNLKTTAVMLQNFLYNLTTTGNVDQITLIGHSMGGLVSRAYLEAVAPTSKYPQDAKILTMVDQLITLGTPHLGAPMALAPISGTLEIVKGLDGEVFFYVLSELFSRVPSPGTIKNLTAIIDKVVNSPGPSSTSPGSGVSTYQLLPNGAFIKAGGKDLPIYPYHTTNLPPDLIQQLNTAGLRPLDLDAAIAFFGALSYTTNPNPQITYQCIYGVVDLAHLAHALELKPVTKTTVGYEFRDKLRARRTEGGGDLVVPKESAMFVGNSSITDAQRHRVLGADHISMPSNPKVQDVVKGLLKFAS